MAADDSEACEAIGLQVDAAEAERLCDAARARFPGLVGREKRALADLLSGALLALVVRAGDLALRGGSPGILASAAAQIGKVAERVVGEAGPIHARIEITLPWESEDNAAPLALGED